MNKLVKGLFLALAIATPIAIAAPTFQAEAATQHHTRHVVAHRNNTRHVVAYRNNTRHVVAHRTITVAKHRRVQPHQRQHT